MNSSLRIIGGAILAAALAANPARAALITQWNFNSNPADANTATGLTTPSVGSGTVSLIGGTTSTFAAGSPGDPAPSGDNSGLNLTSFAAQGAGSGTAGLKVAASTVGFASITLSLDFRQSGTASRYFKLQVSSDGTTFNDVSGGTTSLGTIGSGNSLTAFSTAGIYVNNPGGGSQTFVQSISYSLALGGAYENDANFAFRWVAIFDPTGANGANYISANAGTTANYGTSGTARLDEISISGTAVAAPEPSTWAMVGLGLLGAMAAKRRTIRKND